MTSLQPKAPLGSHWRGLCTLVAHSPCYSDIRRSVHYELSIVQSHSPTALFLKTYADNRYRFMRYVEALEGRKLHEDAIDVKLSLP
jgi:hypothetical protein